MNLIIVTGILSLLLWTAAMVSWQIYLDWREARRNRAAAIEEALRHARDGDAAWSGFSGFGAPEGAWPVDREVG